MKPRTALIIDIVCWVTATLWTLVVGWTVVAALIGATGIMYLYAAIKRYREMLEAERMYHEVQEAFTRGDIEVFDLSEFKTEEDLTNFLQRLKEDPTGAVKELRSHQRGLPEEEAKKLMETASKILDAPPPRNKDNE